MSEIDNAIPLPQIYYQPGTRLYWRCDSSANWMGVDKDMAKKFTGVEGSTVPLKSTIESFDAIARGEFDHVAEQAFFNVGAITDVEEKWAQIQKENG